MKIKTFHINLHVNCSFFHFFLISYDDVGGAYTDFLPEHNTGIDVWGNELSGNDQPHDLFQCILALHLIVPKTLNLEPEKNQWMRSN